MPTDRISFLRLSPLTCQLLLPHRSEQARASCGLKPSHLHLKRTTAAQIDRDSRMKRARTADDSTFCQAVHENGLVQAEGEHGAEQEQRPEHDQEQMNEESGVGVQSTPPPSPSLNTPPGLAFIGKDKRGHK